jgi:MFS family permease
MDESQARIEAIGEQLRAKISSKFQTSAFLGGFGFAALTAEISILWQSPQTPRLLLVSIPLMLASICLYIAALIKLDELTMPKRFWPEHPTEGNPGPHDSRLAYLSDNDLWGLQKRMIFYWYSLTLFATLLMAISIMLMLLPLPPRLYSPEIVKKLFRYTAIFAILLIAYLGLIACLVRYRDRKEIWPPLCRLRD